MEEWIINTAIGGAVTLAVWGIMTWFGRAPRPRAEYFDGTIIDTIRFYGRGTIGKDVLCVVVEPTNGTPHISDVVVALHIPGVDGSYLSSLVSEIAQEGQAKVKISGYGVPINTTTCGLFRATYMSGRAWLEYSPERGEKRSAWCAPVALAEGLNGK